MELSTERTTITLRPSDMAWLRQNSTRDHRGISGQIRLLIDRARQAEAEADAGREQVAA